MNNQCARQRVLSPAGGKDSPARIPFRVVVLAAIFSRAAACAEEPAGVPAQPPAEKSAGKTYENIFRRGDHYMAAGDYEKAVEEYRRGAEALEGDRVVLCLECLERTDAMASLDVALRMHSDDPRLYRMRSEIYMRGLHFERALEDLEKLAELDPEAEGVLVDRGIALMGMGQAERAAESFGAAIENDSRDEEALFWLAAAKARLGDCAGAAAQFEKAYQAGYRDATRESVIERCCEKQEGKCNPQKCDEVAGAARKSQVLGYEEIYPREVVADCYRRDGDYPAAIEIVDGWIERNPGMTRPYFKKAVMLLERDMREQAVETFRAAENAMWRKDQKLKVKSLASGLLLKFGAYRESREIGDEIAADMEGDTGLYITTHYFRGLALLGLGEPAGAAAEFDAVLENAAEAPGSIVVEANYSKACALARGGDTGAAMEQLSKAVGILKGESGKNVLFSELSPDAGCFDPLAGEEGYRAIIETIRARTARGASRFLPEF